MKDKERVIYYSDERNDDFSGFAVESKPLGENYRYVRTGRIYKIFEFLFYYVVMIPVVYMLEKVVCHQKFAKGARRALRQAGKDGCFLVSNHTQAQSDAYIGPLGMFPKKCFIISHPDLLAIGGMRWGMQAYGVIPLGSTLKEKREYLRCVDRRMREGKAVIVYPEAHVWPYYTKIREFDESCFTYLVKPQKPMFVLTNCYQKRRFFKKPQIVTYVDGPFCPDPDVSQKAAAKQMHDIAYETLCRRTREYSTCEYIKYVKAEEALEKVKI